MLGRLLQVSPAHLCSVQCLSALFNKCLGGLQFGASSKECISAVSILVSTEQTQILCSAVRVNKPVLCNHNSAKSAPCGVLVQSVKPDSSLCNKFSPEGSALKLVQCHKQRNVNQCFCALFHENKCSVETTSVFFMLRQCLVKKAIPCDKEVVCATRQCCVQQNCAQQGSVLQSKCLQSIQCRAVLVVSQNL